MELNKENIKKLLALLHLQFYQLGIEKYRDLGDTVPLDNRFNYAVPDWRSAGVCYQCADALCGTKIV